LSRESSPLARRFRFYDPSLSLAASAPIPKFAGVLGVIDFAFFSADLLKIAEGGDVPLLLAGRARHV
jgi:K+ transporter